MKNEITYSEKAKALLDKVHRAERLTYQEIMVLEEERMHFDDLIELTAAEAQLADDLWQELSDCIKAAESVMIKDVNCPFCNHVGVVRRAYSSTNAFYWVCPHCKAQAPTKNSKKAARDAVRDPKTAFLAGSLL